MPRQGEINLNIQKALFRPIYKSILKYAALKNEISEIKCESDCKFFTSNTTGWKDKLFIESLYNKYNDIKQVNIFKSRDYNVLERAIADCKNEFIGTEENQYPEPVFSQFTDRLEQILKFKERFRKNDIIDSQLLYYLSGNTEVFTFDKGLIKYIEIYKPGYEEQIHNIKKKIFNQNEV